ncbi:MAG: extracellular solute-binding protein [Alphaproteobacteria bacterium]
MSKDNILNKLAMGKPSRRDLNKGLAAAGLAMVTLPMIPRSARAADQPIIFTWGGYELPGFDPKYIEDHPEGPDFSLFGDEDEAFAKVAAGFTPDIAHPCSAITKKWYDAGLIQPIDTERLSNWDDVFPGLKTLDNTVYDGERYFIPWDWGQTSVTYRTDLVDIDEESFGLLWDERYAGKLAVIDAAGDTAFVAAIYAGIDIYNLSDDDLARLKVVLEEQKPLLRFYTNDLSSVAQGLAAGELVAALTWNDTAVELLGEGLPVKFMEPKEGALNWVCGYVLIKDAPNLDLAYEVLDSRLDPRAGAYLMTEYGYGHSNSKSFELVGQEQLAKIGLPSDPGVLLDKGHFFAYPDRYTDIVRMFEEVKAGF